MWIHKNDDFGFIKEVKRINVVGNSSCGKTTFGRRLSESLNIPFVEMDSLFWGKNWTQNPDEVFFTKLSNQLSVGEWILDGNYNRTLDIKWEDVQLVIWLDYSFIRTFSRGLKRAVSRAITGKELWRDTGNKESFRKMLFSKDSILLWIITSHRRIRKRYEVYFSDDKYERIKFLRFSNPGEAEKFLKKIKLKVSTANMT